MAAKLTQLQQDFLKQLFGPAQGKLEAAAKALDLDDYSSLMTPELVEAIKTRADHEITLNVARAVFVMKNMLDNPNEAFNMDKVTKLCTEFLDRAGLGRVDRNTTGGLKIGLVILPDKIRLADPDASLVLDQKVEVINGRQLVAPEVS